MSRLAQVVPVVRRLGGGVLDQGLSSLTNVVLGIVVARSLGAEGFGAFTLAYVTYGLVLNASRGLGTDPLVVRFSGPPDAAWRRAVADASGTAVLVGLVGSAGCLLVGLALPGALGRSFLALAVGMPLLMLQDSWRFAFFSAGRPLRACLNDLVWGVLLVGSLVVLARTDRADEVSCVLAFGVTGGVAALLGIVQTGVVPSPRRARAWLVAQKDLGLRYLLENLSVGSARQLRMFLLGALAGLAAVGEVRAAEILMGPFLVIVMGVSQIAVPEASHVLRRSPRGLLHFCLALGGFAAVAAGAWGLLVALVLPLGVGSMVLGPLWVAASALVLPVALGLVFAGLEIGAAAGVRALAAARRSLAAQLTTSVLYVCGGTLGAWWGGAVGSCWGVTLGIAVGTLVWWVQLRRALRDHVRDHPAARSPSPSHPDTERIPR